MMAREENFQLEGDAPHLYEAEKVPAIFKALAEATLERAGVTAGARVLDVACGTGIVARLAAAAMPPGSLVAGIDQNAGMLRVAAAVAEQKGLVIDWRQCDVCAMPFASASFDLVFCQQGLQFFPDRAGALREMARVLTPRGRLALTVWKSVSPYGAALSRALTKFVSRRAGERALAPFSFDETDEIAVLAGQAGFTDVKSECFTILRRMGPAEESILADIAGMPYAGEVAAIAADKKAALVNQVAGDLKDFKVPGGYAIPCETFLVTATRAA
ncbi:methyltransferase domain-containing protein [Limibacillus sp. MBR-115]|jgi:ubiquinone/menaquinone biosynthesis C-methylase UbiE|uniref:class I SAM-dependent methyltransferase n=1 Tax=Limibacillus sp. MBR-115 TaxID=3156465 RepID=UPI003397D18B